MTTRRLDPIADRADALFEEHIKPLVAQENEYDFLAIDVESGDFKVGPDDLTSVDTLRARCPNAVIFLRRVGDDAAYSITGGYID